MTESELQTTSVVVSNPQSQRLKVAALVAAAISIPFAAVPLVIAIKVIPTLESLFRDMGGSVPPITQALIDMSHSGLLAVVVVLLEIALFVGMYALARRYWIGFVFVAPLTYLAVAALMWIASYWPVFDILNQVQ